MNHASTNGCRADAKTCARYGNMDGGTVWLRKTKHSDFARTTLAMGGSIDLLANESFLLNQFLAQSYKEDLAVEVKGRWAGFLAFLEQHKLRLSKFTIRSAGNRYLLYYEVESEVYQNPALFIEREMRADIAYNFVPAFFVAWLDTLLNAVPYADLRLVANGH